jgi:hypothetical protein
MARASSIVRRVGRDGETLYCGRRYLKSGERCIDGTCDGQCGPSGGCPCPEWYKSPLH